MNIRENNGIYEENISLIKLILRKKKENKMKEEGQEEERGKNKHDK